MVKLHNNTVNSEKWGLLNMNTRGSEWHQWDLHLHTPSSFDYHDKSVTNQQIIDVLKANDIKGVAITDHNTIDIERIKALRELAGNDITILPGIELRSELGGSESVHFICIFPENISLSTLQTKFLGKVNLTDEDIEKETHEKIYRDLSETVAIARELGGIVTIHAGDKSNSVEKLSNKLPEKQAQKTDIVKNIDIYEVGKLQDIEDYRKKVFPYIKMIRPTIICSDNHNIKKYDRKEKLWIKSDITFEGLKQAIKEPELRFFVGDEPHKLTLVRNIPDKFIDYVQIKGINNENNWFNDVLPLNQDLVTIIGNKGNGKSALADIIGHAGNTHNVKFSFLSEERFNQKPDYLGKEYTVKVKWKNGVEEEKQLFPINNQELVEKVKYLPQRYIEFICNDLSDGFNAEIERLIFDYLPREEKLQKSSLNELMRYITDSIEKDITSVKSELQSINKEIIQNEDKITDNKIKALYMQKEDYAKHLEQELKNKPKEVVKPNIDPVIEEKLTNLNIRMEELNNKLEVKNKELEVLTNKKHVLDTCFSNIQETKSNMIRWEEEVNTYLKNNYIEKSIKMEFNVVTYDLNVLHEEINNQILNIKEDVSTYEQDGKDGRIITEVKKVQNEIIEIKNNLSQTEKIYQVYVENTRIWQERITTIAKNKENIEEQIENLERQVPIKLEELYKKRKDIAKKIYDLKISIIRKYEEKYSYIKKVIETLSIEKTEKPTIAINLYLNTPQIHEQLLSPINRQVKSIFRGVEDGKDQLNKMLETMNVDDFDSISTCIENIDKQLKESTTDHEKLFKDRIGFYNALYGLDYLTNSYELKLGDKPLSKLSPGEKGLLLLIFYLILDRENCPLIIDQPEDNLDNQSIFNRLVPYIIKAKENRQIIIVTHNPNIAVACDSEQIIYSNMDKAKMQIQYSKGSMEREDIKNNIVDVLEGTMPAFEKRSEKYGY